MSIGTNLLLDTIFLLCNDETHKYDAQVQKLLDIYEQESKQKTYIDPELINFYVRLIKMLLSDGIRRDNLDDRKRALIQFKSDPAIEKHRDVYDLLYDALVSGKTLSEDQMATISERIHMASIHSNLHTHMKVAYGRLNRLSDMSNVEDQRRELSNIRYQISNLQNTLDTTSSGSAKPQGMVDSISFSDKDSLKDGITKYNHRNVHHVIRMGLQGLNKMMGPSHGAMAGESVIFAALLHHYKSGMLQSIAMWSTLYNIPPRVEGKKPMVLMISLENEAYQNMMWMFRQNYRMRTGEDPKNMTDDAIAEWVYEVFNANDMTLVIERFLPSEFGYEDLVGRIEYFEAQGYYIYACIIDYMSNMKKTSSNSGTTSGNHLLLKDLYSKTCNYTKSKGITLFTAHQLTRRAQELSSSGITNVVRRFTPEHLADAIDVGREVDAIIFMHLETNHEGLPFLTMNIAKHRYVDDTPVAHKYCAYPFTKLGIFDDLHAEKPTFTRDIYTYGLDIGSNTQKDTSTKSVY